MLAEWWNHQNQAVWCLAHSSEVTPTVLDRMSIASQHLAGNTSSQVCNKTKDARYDTSEIPEAVCEWFFGICCTSTTA